MKIDEKRKKKLKLKLKQIYADPEKFLNRIRKARKSLTKYMVKGRSRVKPESKGRNKPGKENKRTIAISAINAFRYVGENRIYRKEMDKILGIKKHIGRKKEESKKIIKDGILFWD